MDSDRLGRPLRSARWSRVAAGVAASFGGVMLVEYLALSRLVHAVTSWSLRPIVAGICTR